jgi:outer membrane protein OmpA-like peptidoglycan-associated protein
MKLIGPGKLKHFAENAIHLGDIYSAIDYYEQYCKYYPNDIKTAFELAQLYLRARDYKKAGDWFFIIYSAKPNKYKLALFYHSLCLKYNGDYKKSLEGFIKFKKEYKKRDRSHYSKIVKNEIAGCEIAPRIIDSVIKASIIHLDTSVNKAHIEFSPVPVDPSTLLYASFKADGVIYYDPVDSMQKIPVRKFYIAKKEGEQWKGGFPLEGPFNDDHVNTGNGAYSPDGNRFFFTRCEKNRQNEMICSVYLSEKENNKWQEPVKLGKEVNHPRYTSTQPAIGASSKPGQEVLYFISDRKGGKGGLDIWYSIYDTKLKVFTDAKNAGGNVNTFGDEITPYYDNDNHALYFSSNGWPGIGGLDIFRAYGELRKFLAPQNVGYPINSSVDDVYYIIAKDKANGFFASNRIGTVSLKSETCCDDIYNFIFTDFIRIAVTGQIYAIEDSAVVKKLNEKFQFTNDFQAYKDSNLVHLFDSVAISLYMVDDETGEAVWMARDTTSNDGRYFFNLQQGNSYQLKVDNYSNFNKQVNVSTKEIYHSDTIIMDAIWIDVIPKIPIILKNIYYVFDKYYLTDSAKLTIDTTVYDVLQKFPDLIIEISSHTDIKGTDEYNITLSQNRAQSVVDYLISKGIDKKRLIAKGYGKTQFIAPNFNPDGSDNPEGRQKNRRTEFKITGTLSKDSKYYFPDTKSRE